MISFRKLLSLGALAAAFGLVDARPARAQTPAPSPLLKFLNLNASPGGIGLTAGPTTPSGGIPAVTPVVPQGNTIFN